MNIYIVFCNHPLDLCPTHTCSVYRVVYLDKLLTKQKSERTLSPYWQKDIIHIFEVFYLIVVECCILLVHYPVHEQVWLP